MRQAAVQKQTIAPQMRESLRLLAMDSLALRESVLAEIASNPVIEIGALRAGGEERSAEELERLAMAEDARTALSQWPDDDYSPADEWTSDADAAERRARFFDTQTAEESLEEHLVAQLPSSGIAPKDAALARALIGELDSRGWFAGSIPDIEMVYGVDEAHIRRILGEIMKLDPPGCGATSLEECLLAQLDNPSSVAGRLLREGLLSEAALEGGEGRDRVAATLGVERTEVDAAMALVATLEPRPARAYPVHGKRIEYIRPEIRAVKDGDRYLAVVAPSGLPEIHVSKKYLAMLSDPTVGADAKKYLREKIASAQFMADSLARREKTLAVVAQAIFDAQKEFFEKGETALVPMTMHDIAAATGLHHTTVSRTVAGKYAATPRGTVELRRFFTSGWKGADGEEISQRAAMEALKAIVASENAVSPLSDGAIAEAMKAAGYGVARRTVAKYRARLGIEEAAKRKSVK